MTLTQLEIRNVRSLASVSLTPASGLNLVIGANASGKTSLLESIHLLGTGKSFRTLHTGYLFQHEVGQLMVSGRCQNSPDSQVSLALERDRNGYRIRVNGQYCKRIATLARMLPQLVISPDTHHAFLNSAKHRRGALDWGLFHIEPNFYPLWSNYQRTLKQRNAALKDTHDNQTAHFWNNELVKLAEQIHQFRCEYLSKWRQLFKQYCRQLLGSTRVDLSLKPGWSPEKKLADVLVSDHYRDCTQGFTHSGAHRADIEIEYGGQPSRQHASHGQQKLLVIALRLAQLELFTQKTGQHCLFLLDDLAAELDSQHRSQLMDLLAKSAAQAFVTATDVNMIDTSVWQEFRVFHVKQGTLKSL